MTSKEQSSTALATLEKIYIIQVGDKKSVQRRKTKTKVQTRTGQDTWDRHNIRIAGNDDRNNPHRI